VALVPLIAVQAAELVSVLELVLELAPQLVH